jgi:uncharacterized membrane protein
MAYCCQCGAKAFDSDAYCGVCGARQPGVNQPSRAGEGMSPRTVSILCYIPLVGWIAAIVVLASQRFRDNADVRFNAFQGIYLFVLWLVVDWMFAPFDGLRHIFSPMRGLVNPFTFFGGALRLVVWGCWIFMMIKVSEGVRFRLPLLGELAERSIAEQR